ncbi:MULTISPECIES: DNA cytosine methyltransferase [Bacillus]|uniref:DNA cytosine methyltransferase n=1 Tax=Bacillus TaxID=1386 RepID=UPI000BA2E854|nr:MULTISPECIES: DNA cytosine methyltransferase [Bacillus]MBY0034272.1 DNA cytosine methyltransferase [Bacillus velezensis]MBY0042236.1 DNA cytosine methyltransferase [Bacillus velezensis]MCY1637710.1 DNA cytosine methyltransferase [Bacillus sp. SL112]MEC2019379.1 DNA cytosine methyltransferase [Bacillus velezensis]PAB04842.1 hypothetical protein BHU79_06970 [Bacillus velezensis]
MMKLQKKFKAVDLFCGAGGVSEALKRNFEVRAAVEFDPVIAKTYALNHGDEHLIVDDIRNINEDVWMDKIRLKPKELDLLVATPPCQGFSKHARRKAKESKDERNQLILETLKVTKLFQPKYIFFENVDNITNFDVFHQFIHQLLNVNCDGYKLNEEEPSYLVDYKVINASDYGVPQRRKRLILLAQRADIFPIVDTELSIWPEKKEQITLGELLCEHSLSKLEAGETDPDDPLHTVRSLSDLNLKRIRNTPHDGGSRKDWPAELLLECHKKGNVGFGDVYGRMDRNAVAPTITTGCISYSKGRFGHPAEDRAISLREAALIQTFPIDYKFTGQLSDEPFKGSKEKMATQIGNAVPVKLAEAFLERIVNRLKEELN